MSEPALASNVVRFPIERRDSWLDKKQLSASLPGQPSVRFIEYRVAEGMPSRMMFGKRRFQLDRCEAWLIANGFIEEAS